jgi:hypothetical protein
MITQPAGKPIIASTQAGFRCPGAPPVTVSDSGREFRAIDAGLAPPVRQSRADGLGSRAGHMPGPAVISGDFPAGAVSCPGLAGEGDPAGVGGNEEEPVPEMRRTERGCGDTIPPRIEPEAGKVAEDICQTGPDELGDVLDEDERRPAGFDGVPEGGPEPAGVSGAELAAGRRMGLTGESAAGEVDPGSGLTVPPFRERVKVIVLRDVRPAHGQHAPAPGIDLHLGGDPDPPGPLQAQVQAADPAAEGHGCQLVSHVTPGPPPPRTRPGPAVISR